MLKIRRPLGRLIFNMGIAIPGKTVFLIETAPRRNESARPLHKSPHWIVSLIVLRHATLTFELHVYSGLNTNLWYMLWHTTRIRMIQEALPREIIFHLGLLRFNLGDQRIEWNKSLVAVFRKYSMLIFVNIRYETTIPSVTCVHSKFHYENLISP